MQGGGINNSTYTNSLEALNQNVTHYELFELDFNFTSDEKLVCIHDWKENAAQIFQARLNQPLTLYEFRKLTNEKSQFHNCDFETLSEWLRKNPSKRIVTDVKKDNIKALSFIAQNFPDAKRRFIPQIYHPKEYLAVRGLGYEKIILTLYKCKCNDLTVMASAIAFDYYAVTMTLKTAANLAKPLRKIGVPTYVHTINTDEGLKFSKDFGAEEIYTDWLKAF